MQVQVLSIGWMLLCYSSGFPSNGVFLSVLLICYILDSLMLAVAYGRIKFSESFAILQAYEHSNLVNSRKGEQSRVSSDEEN